jgi:hypothetical protein
MSIFEKKRQDRSYVYFQTYGEGKRRVLYLGASDEMETWEKAERLFLEHLDQRLEGFYSRIPTEFKTKVQPNEDRRRLLEAEPKQQVAPPKIEIPAVITMGRRTLLTAKKRKSRTRKKP